MERFDATGRTDSDAARSALDNLVELIVAISDESDDQWQIGDRVGAVVRGGSNRPLAV